MRVKKSRQRWLWVAGALVMVLAGTAVWMLLDASAGRRMPDEGREHVPAGTPVTYRHYPPTSGPHWPRPAPWGHYEQEVPPEIWVHNLEHGGIVILYHCDTPCPELVRQLQDVYATFPKSKYGHVKLLIVPDKRLKTRLATLAWNWMDETDTFDRKRLLRFYRAYMDRGPEDVP